MLWLTEDAVIRCDHAGTGKVTGYSPAQSWVTIANRRVLIRPDPVGRTIDGCIMKPPQVPKQCTLTTAVTKGYSAWVRINRQPVCLSSVIGMTDGVPPTNYRVHDPAQKLVAADA
jgi:hypothetical protein